MDHHVAELRQLILDLTQEVREPRHDRDAPVRGLREAAAVLRVSRSQNSSKINVLPPERRPLTAGKKHTVVAFEDGPARLVGGRPLGGEVHAARADQVAEEAEAV